MSQNITKSLISKGVFPYWWAFTLLIPLRRFVLSPKQLMNRLGLKPTHQVLEVGCGPGYFSIPFAKYLDEGHLTLVDIQQQMLDYAEKRIKKHQLENRVSFYSCNGHNFDMIDTKFDRIVLVAVLGEVVEKQEYIKEFYRLLKLDGILSITELGGDPDRLSVVEVKDLVEPKGFNFDMIFGGRKQYTLNFKKHNKQYDTTI